MRTESANALVFRGDHPSERGCGGQFQDCAFLTQACSYPDGTKVFCSAMLDIANGKIVRQTAVQAWDA